MYEHLPQAMMDLETTSVWEKKITKSFLGDHIETLIRRSPHGKILEEHIIISKRPDITADAAKG
jgi:hypothetical protein